MKKLDQADLTQAGRFIEIYGETGVGKTTSVVQSAPDPICYIQTEPRSLKPSLDTAGRPELDLDIFVYENFHSMMEFITQPTNFDRYATVVVDSFTSLV